MKDLFTTLGNSLRPHAALVSKGMKPEQAISLFVNPDLSFKTTTMTLTETYRRQLKTIAESVDVNINALLGMLTPAQAEQVIAEHKHICWSDPDDESGLKDIHLDGFERDGNNKGWFLMFTTKAVLDGDKPYLIYKLHDLDIQDVLGLLATIENVIYEPVRNAMVE